MKILIPLLLTAAYDKENRNQEQNEEIACHQSIGVKYECNNNYTNLYHHSWKRL